MFTYYKRFDVDITDPNKTYNADFDLDKDAKNVTGFLLTSNLDDQLYYRGEQSITINGIEFFPSDYESKLLMSGINVEPCKRFYTIPTQAVVNGKIKISYTDKNHPQISFVAYRISIYIRGEKPDQT